MDQQLTEINQRLDSLITFVQEKVVTKDELEDLKAQLPTRADFARLQTSVDGTARSFINTQQEVLLTSAKMTRLEEWVQEAARKIGVEYKP
jgi:hypothetical protein